MSAGGKRQARRPEVAGVPISSGRRQVDATSGTHKLDLVRFYADMADWLLPQLDNRPVSLVRAPKGVDGAQFFHRHAHYAAPRW